MVDVATSDSQKRQGNGNGFLVRLTAILALLSKRARKSKPAPKEDEWKIDLKSPKSRPKKLLINMSSKTLFGHNNKKKQREEVGAAEEWGNGGVWQKEILMGGKCEPLDFSGVIYYDGNGKQMSEIPLRSPRASPLPGYLSRHPPQQTL